jgi:DNA-binding GntR family transcriptional regulator
MDRISAEGDVDGYFRENLEFHEALFRCTGNHRLWAVYVGLVKELHLFRWRSFFPVANLAVSNAEHHRIIDAVAAGDARTAGRAFEKHVQVGKKRMLEALADSDLF